MGILCGIIGKREPGIVRSMAQAMAHRGTSRRVIEGPNFAVAADSEQGEDPNQVDGTPRNGSGRVLTAKELAAACAVAGAPTRLRIRGAFAAALCVKPSGVWWFIRDRLGTKPLYYAQGDGFLLFASELKGILASGLIPRHISLASVDHYLALGCVPGPETILQGIRRVQPGHIVQYSQGRIAEFSFASWHLGDVDMPREEAAERIREFLRAALAGSNVRDLLWSGGLDCAALAALKPGLLPAFVVLERSWQNEARHAKEAARRLKLPLVKVSARRMTEEVFRRVVYHLDEPIADASVFPLWLIMEQAGTEASALISGHGADEVLGGYPRYLFLQKAHGGAQGFVPVNLLSSLLPALPPNAFVRRAGRYLAAIHDNVEAYLSLLSVFDEGERNELYTDAMKAALHEHGGTRALLRAHFGERDLAHNLLSLDLNVVLPELLLVGCDRIAAAHGVSMEFPYLDEALVDFTAQLSPRTKYGVRSKPLLRLATKGLLPGNIRWRARRGFKIPQDGRVARVVENVARTTVTQERVEASGLFRWPHIERILRSAGHNVYRRRQFWALLMFFTWYREFMET